LLILHGAVTEREVPANRIRGAKITTDPRINDRIRTPQIRLIGYTGEQVGVVDIEVALQMADEVGLDLVEIAPEANPPVCKIMDFGKYKYEIAQKAREARQNQTHIVVKEPELGYKILQRLAEDVAEIAFVEFAPKQEGRNMTMVLGPTKRKTEAVAEAKAARKAKADAAAAAAETE